MPREKYIGTYNFEKVLLLLSNWLAYSELKLFKQQDDIKQSSILYSETIAFLYSLDSNENNIKCNSLS